MEVQKTSEFGAQVEKTAIWWWNEFKTEYLNVKRVKGVESLHNIITYKGNIQNLKIIF